MSPPERIVWSKVRDGQLRGLKFRRQRPLGPYILDFYCSEANLCIEIDGQAHAERREADTHRDAYLRAHGVKTLRFTVTDVMTNLDGVLSKVRREASARRGAGDRED